MLQRVNKIKPNIVCIMPCYKWPACKSMPVTFTGRWVWRKRLRTTSCAHIRVMILVLCNCCTFWGEIVGHPVCVTMSFFFYT
jgi:hypothetical protein